MVPVRYRTVGGDMYDARQWKGTKLQFEPQVSLQQMQLNVQLGVLSSRMCVLFIVLRRGQYDAIRVRATVFQPEQSGASTED